MRLAGSAATANSEQSMRWKVTHHCLFGRLRTMVKMARSHTSGQHALSCTAVEPGQLAAAEWRLRHSGCVTARVAPDRGLGFAVSQARHRC